MLLLVGGAMFTLLARDTAPVYRARSVVTAVSTPIPVEEFEIAVTLFNTDEVIGPVADQVDGGATTATLLAEGRLAADWVSGGGLEITGKDLDPQRAVLLANSAAESFAATLERKQLGTFAILSASEAAQEVSGSRIVDLIGGGALGGFLGVTLLLVVFMLRQPLLTEEEALEEFPADKVFSARVQRQTPFGLRSMRPSIAPSGVTAAIEREISATSTERRSSVCCVIIGRRRADAIQLLLAEMGVFKRWPLVGERHSPARYWLEAGDELLPEALHATGVVIILVSQGSSRGLLRGVADEMLVTQEEQTWIMLFVKRAHGQVNQLLRGFLARPKGREWKKTLQRGSK